MAQHTVRINPDLIIISAALKSAYIVSGKSAALTARVAGDAESIVVLDADGNPVEFKRVFLKWKTGSRPSKRHGLSPEIGEIY